MAFRHHDLALDGTAQRLSTALADSTVGGADDVPLRAVILQPDGANAAPVHVGSSDAVSSSVHALRLEPGSAGVPPAPFVLGEFSGSGPLRLSDFWVVGTNGEELHIGTVPY